MNISLTPELEELINRKVESGMYNSASEVVRESLRLLHEQDELRRIRFEELRRDIMNGYEQLQQGKSVSFESGESLFQHIVKEGKRSKNARENKVKASPTVSKKRMSQLPQPKGVRLAPESPRPDALSDLLVWLVDNSPDANVTRRVVISICGVTARFTEELILTGSIQFIGITAHGTHPRSVARLRSLAVARYVVFYQPTKNGVEIVRVLHGSRDAEQAFAEQIGEAK